MVINGEKKREKVKLSWSGGVKEALEDIHFL